jgi:tRNA(fMet)-specific endonuclease VapC
MKYVLDTNVCIKILRGNSASLLKRIEVIYTGDIIIPAIVRFELYYGAYKSDGKNETLMKLNDFLKSFDTIDIDNQIAETAGKIRSDLDKKGIPIGPYDVLIGATALTKKHALITHNVKEFSRIEGLAIEDWEK